MTVCDGIGDETNVTRGGSTVEIVIGKGSHDIVVFLFMGGHSRHDPSVDNSLLPAEVTVFLKNIL